MSATPETRALDLLRGQRVLVLATAGPDPWSAPVYFLHRVGRLLFFSSPRSRHVAEALRAGRCAGSVHHDGDDWRAIEGLQMEGTLVEVADGPEAAGAVAAYADRFPAVKELLGRESPDLARFEEVLGARLYAFVPGRAFYVNNQAGLRGRTEIQLPRP